VGQFCSADSLVLLGGGKLGPQISRRSHKPDHWARTLMANPRNPAGPPMTLGNMRHLGVQGWSPIASTHRAGKKV